MRIVIGRRLMIALLFLLGGALAAPAIDTPNVDVAAQGQGQGKAKGQGTDKEKDHKEKKEKKEKEARGPGITQSEGYRVEVGCEYDDGEDTSTCTFTGVVPEGAKKLNQLDVPAETVCAEVVGGEYKNVDPDPNTGVTGYQTKGSSDTVTLVLAGKVDPSGTATYWIKAASAILPAPGAGLSCGDGTTATFELQTTPGSADMAPQATATPTATTGELVVLLYTCGDVPEDTTGFDWFQSCNSEGGVHELALSPVSEVAVTPQTTETDASGDATFTDLEPGLYSLEMTEITWCKAVSDNVDAEGNVIIEAGQRTTVYGFMCEGIPAS